MNYFDPEGDLNLCIPMVAHEMMTSIHITKGYGELLRESIDDLNQKVKDYHRLESRELEHLRQLIQKLLNLYRYHSCSVTLKLSNVDLLSLVHQELKPFQDQYPDINFVTDLSPLEAVLLDRDEIRELLRVMFENGVKYTPKGCDFMVSVFQDQRATTLCFKSLGVGIDDTQKVLKPFQRACSMQAGVGLGFVIAQHITKLHGGDFDLKSDGETYTQIEVSIPHLKPE